MPYVRSGIDIVLVGGGHAHVHVLKVFAERPEPGVRITLITRDLKTLYSGMLPGVIAGLYTAEQAHIDLVGLASAAGARLIQAEAIGIDRANKRVNLFGHPPVDYDIASIDVGITPALAAIRGAAEHGIAVKPIGSFLAKFSDLLARCRRPDGPRRIAVIGGGAGGMELLLALRTRLLAEAKATGRAETAFSFVLVTAGEILESHDEWVRRTFRRILAEREIELRERQAVHAVTACGIMLGCGAMVAADAALMTTDAAPPVWFGDTRLALDKKGFIAVGPTLQSLDDPNVFAAGDCAALTETPCPKAGVFAVRAGPPLADNLRHRARSEPLKKWEPQQRHLALIATGERHAVVSHDMFKAEGAWVWWLKNWIDRRWIRQYQKLPG